MKGISKIALLLMAALLVFTGCQSQDVETSTVVETAAAPAAAPAIPAAPAAPAPAPAPAQEPVLLSDAVYSYLGYDLGVKAYDGYALITYPSIATKADVEAVFAAFVAVDPSLASAIRYSFVDDTTVRLDFAKGISAADLRAFSAVFGASVLEAGYAAYPSEESFTAVYTYGGFSLKTDVYPGLAIISYPDAISESDMAAFLEAEAAAYAPTGLLDGVEYSLDSAEVLITFPDTDRAAVVALTAPLASDLVAYFGM